MKPSLRNRLVVSLALGLAFSAHAVLGLTLYVARGEIDELYNRNMEQVAATVQAGPGTARPQPPPRKPALRALDHEETFLIQIWDRAGHRTYSNFPEVDFPLTSAGHGERVYQNRPWRYYARYEEDGVVQVVQPAQAREDAILEILQQFGVTSLLQLPLLVGLIWLVVRYSLAPLREVSQAIRTRDSHLLHPLSTDGLPVELEPMVEALNDLFIRLHEALEAQKNFTADAAHELRTPLTALQLQLDILKRAKTRDQHREALALLTEGIKRSTRVVQQLLSLARQGVDTGTTGAEAEFGQVVRDVVERLQPVAAASSLSLELGQVDDTRLPGRATDLAVLVENLIDNAIRYTPAGGRVRAQLLHQNGAAVLTVTDTGPGIPLNERPKVFERFYRVLGNTAMGSGLGLAIVKAIAEAHNAEIRLSDTAPQGLTATLIFPGVLSHL
ncbi:ATP-binding protein [Asticcacaulis sp.]|uniref:ATP-binding protein n=1 Tax=Asticcacaulis sp. TaxID=1872648 RepID=UPI0031DE5736